MESHSAYRPIVLLDEISELFKRIVTTRIVKHLEHEGLNLAESQFGFRKGRSTHGVVSKIPHVQSSFQGEFILMVSLDISNAVNILH